MAYFNIEETNPGILEEKITYTPDIVKQFVDLKQNEVPEETLVSGQSYGVEELLRRTIVDSDNASYYLLAAHIEKVQGGDASVFRVFQELGIIDPRNVSEEVSTVRNYASLFRLLYNVSYLSPEHSEELLGWLSEATYHKGLSAGVPAGVRVAHKFGERFLPNEKKQLHDCGIVYYPRNPYILCVMTKGDDWDKMTAIIREVSKMTYTEVDGRKISSFKR